MDAKRRWRYCSVFEAHLSVSRSITETDVVVFAHEMFMKLFIGCDFRHSRLAL